MNPKRKAFEDKVLKFMDIQDPTGYNTNHMKTFFSELTDAQFKDWAQALKDKKAKIPFYTIPFQNPVQTENIVAAAKFLGLAMFERIKVWDSVGQRYYMTPHKYPILRWDVRRLKQHRDDGISVPESDRRLNPLTDQVVQPDKGSAISLPQAQVMVSMGLYRTTDEFMSVRGGDQGAYTQYKKALEETGRVSLSEITDSTGVKSAEMLHIMLLGMHLGNNV